MVKPYTGKGETLYRQEINLIQARDKPCSGKGETVYGQGINFLQARVKPYTFIY